MVCSRNAVLQEAESIDEPGGIVRKLAAYLLASWIAVYLCMVLDVKSYGKVKPDNTNDLDACY